MRHLPELFANNRAWAERRVAQEPDFFSRLRDIQSPRYLWIGCADSRVPANEIVGLAPGEMFVHRNIANVVHPDDANCLSVLQYAVEVLRVRDVIVCGHYGCGGVQAALGAPVAEPLESWIASIRAVRHQSAPDLGGDETARWRRLCELNVATQVRELARLPLVAKARERGQALFIHGWIYDLHDGLLRDLEAGVSP